MLKGLDTLMDGVKDLQKEADALFNMAADPQIVMNMTKAQLDFMAEARAAMNFRGKTPEEISNILNELIKKHNITDTGHGT